MKVREYGYEEEGPPAYGSYGQKVRNMPSDLRPPSVGLRLRPSPIQCASLLLSLGSCPCKGSRVSACRHTRRYCPLNRQEPHLCLQTTSMCVQGGQIGRDR